MSEGLHHFHKRKRIYQKLEPYPHPDKLKRVIDKCIYIVTLFGLVMTIPQLTKIWLGKNAEGVSVISWTAYLFSAGFWMAYGVVHKEKPIIFSNLAWIILELFIIIGIVMYG